MKLDSRCKICRRVGEKLFLKGERCFSQKCALTRRTLLDFLEHRLDNVVYRLGFAKSRRMARQIVDHGHILVNKRKVNIPSYQVKKGDVIEIKKTSIKKGLFKDLSIYLKNYQVPSWLSLDKENLKGKVIGEPTIQDIGKQAEVEKVIEFYSR